MVAPEPEAPPLRLVKQPRVARVTTELDEEFMFADGSQPRPPKSAGLRSDVRLPRVGRRGVTVLIVAVFAVVALLVMRSLGSQDESTSPPEPAAAAVAPAPQPAAPTGVPLTLAGYHITPNTASDTYVARLSIRNPTDVAAAEVSVEVTLKDASGNVLKTEKRFLDMLPSGKTADVEVRGEFAQSQVPASVDATAIAARLVSSAA
jgi:hypothetical protein